ncbi:MAG: ABC transporter permease [Chloroflexi bacterium]|nr:ABC transporter permease [Chloroflexota bacterium]
MKRIIDIALNDLRIIFKDRGIWINLVVLPIVIAVAVGYANGAGVTANPGPVRIRVDVFDADGSAESAQFLEQVRAVNSNLVLCPMDQTEADVCGLGGVDLTPELAQTRLEDQVALATLEIPVGFGAALTSGEAVNVVYRSNEDATAPSYILQAVQAAATRLSGAQIAGQVGGQIADTLTFLQFSDDADRAAFVESIQGRAAQEWEADLIAVETVQASLDPSTTQGLNTGEGFAQSIPGMASMYVMFTVLPAASAFILERKNWTLQRLATLPVSRTQILAGKLLARFTMGMIQYAILFGFGVLVLNVNFGSQPLTMLPVMMAYTACVTALALALTTFITTDMQAQGITLFMSLTLAPLGGAWWPLEIVPEWMRVVGHISPIAWAMDAYREIIFYGGGLGDVIVPIVVLLAATVVLFAVGVTRFRFTK